MSEFLTEAELAGWRRPSVPAKRHDGQSRSDIVNDACRTAGTTIEIARSQRPDRDAAWRRFHVMAILRGRDWSLNQIGVVLNRDHTTVHTGIVRYNALVASGDYAEWFKVCPIGVVRLACWRADISYDDARSVISSHDLVRKRSVVIRSLANMGWSERLIAKALNRTVKDVRDGLARYDVLVARGVIGPAEMAVAS